MQIPKRLKIGGHTFTVQFVDKIPPDDAFGVVHQSKLLIELRNNLPLSQLESTFIHEILHAINYNLTEEQVEYMANALYQVFKDNKIIFDGK